MNKKLYLLASCVSILLLSLSELKADDSCFNYPDNDRKCDCAKPVASLINGVVSISCGKTYCSDKQVCTSTGECCSPIEGCSFIVGATCKCGECKDGTTKNSTEEKCCPIIANCSTYDANCGCQTCAEGYTTNAAGKCCPTIANCSTYDANCGCQTCAEGYDLKDGKCEAGDICASYSCGENQKAVTNYNSNGEVIGCTCCRSEVIYTEDECVGYWEDDHCVGWPGTTTTTYSAVGAINGVCCGGKVSEILTGDEYDNFTKTYEIIDGSKGLRCVMTSCTASCDYDVSDTQTCDYDGNCSETDDGCGTYCCDYC